MVSCQRNRTIREEEVEGTAIGGEEHERDFKGEFHKKQETTKPYTYFS